jgi:hypothetical protein
MRVLIIGAGLFGSTLGFVLAQNQYEIDIIDEEDDIMKKASLANHNRIHLGYHYLRSIETAEQSIEGLLSFLFNFGDSVIYQFPNYYAISKNDSKTTPEQFIDFCKKVGIGYDEKYPEKDLLNFDLIEACFKVPEPVWDYKSLKTTILKKLDNPNINVYLKTKCNNINLLSDGTFKVDCGGKEKYYDYVINCTYANINNINAYLGIEPKKLLYEDVIIPVFKHQMEKTGLTVMDGPFCSVMPFGRNENTFLLYHVQASIIDSKISKLKPNFEKQNERIGDIIQNVYDSSEDFMPFIKNVEHIDYLRTVRAVYENSDDARISEIYTYKDVKNYFTVLSGKVTTCVQVALEIKHLIEGKQSIKRFKI